MIVRPASSEETWCVRESGLDLQGLAHSESIFALSNGHLGLRGNLDEGDPYGVPGTYLNGLYELRPLPYAEAGYGYPESGQSVINVTNGKVFRLLVDDEPFDVRYGRVIAHERTLDLRAGTLSRELSWESPAGQGLRLRTVRLVSFTQRAVAAISYEVEAIGDRARVVVQSELVANEPLPQAQADPRAAAVLESPLISEGHTCRNETACELVHRTARSELRLAAAMDHLVEGPTATDVSAEIEPDTGRVTVTTVLEPGERLRIVKFLAYGWSSLRSRQALRDQVVAAVTAAAHTGWDGLVTEQQGYLQRFWGRAGIEVEGNPQIEQAARFALFQVLQGGARAERRALPAKGLTGTGYEGHSFWDSEMFVLPVLTYTMPSATADALRWRHSTLPTARHRAELLNLCGAAFPWRTVGGEECSGYWPAGTAAFHVNGDIADAVVRYVEATEDAAFEDEVGVELLVETARLWRSLGHYDGNRRFRLPGVTGPDEYSALGDDNVYTNLMAQQNLQAAADAAERHPDRASSLGVQAEELVAWRQAAEAVFVPYDHELEVHPQAVGFTSYERWDFEGTQSYQYPLFLHFPYFELYRKQVVKQADLVLAMHVRGDAFTDAEKARNFAYYEPLTVRDSSLSASTQAVMAAETGHMELAYEYAREALLLDLHDLHGNTGNGLHLASLAGGWTALVAGFGGFRARNGSIGFAPRLPPAITSLVFRLWFRGRCLQVTTTPDDATYLLQAGEPLEVTHHGELITVTCTEPCTRKIPTAPYQARPPHPLHRDPAKHLLTGDE
ncbi:MAG: GH65 [uncultured Acidimicrobiales bacterium]|uniref:GH65 n=1 Tax=uncultured Acidimicrobiales bacterium TaxID=310071 RepID=A0A6J4JID1_9ACTN|nr:MAG: GH65 [uncultured Acidimicrobiales bacterium]